MSSVVAAKGLPHAKPVPTLVASRVGMSLALATSVPTSLVLLTLTRGWACVRHGGRGFTRGYYCSSHSGLQEGKFRLYLGKINIIYALANHLFYLVFYPGAALRCKLVQKRLDF